MRYKAICIDNTDNLILYKKYMIEDAEFTKKCVHVYDENGMIYNRNYGILITIFSKSKFKFIKELRENRINQLI